MYRLLLCAGLTCKWKYCVSKVHCPVKRENRGLILIFFSWFIFSNQLIFCWHINRLIQKIAWKVGQFMFPVAVIITRHDDFSITAYTYSMTNYVCHTQRNLKQVTGLDCRAWPLPFVTPLWVTGHDSTVVIWHQPLPEYPGTLGAPTSLPNGGECLCPDFGNARPAPSG